MLKNNYTILVSHNNEKMFILFKSIVIGLAAVILGQSVIHARRFAVILLSVVLGAIIYRFFIALALNSDFIGLKAQDLNLVTALLVTIALIMPKLKKLIKKRDSDA